MATNKDFKVKNGVLAGGDITASGSSNTTITAITTATTGVAGLSVQADAGTQFAMFRQWGSAATNSNFGITLGGWATLYTPLGATTTNGLIIGTSNASPIVFGTNAAERMRIDSSGNMLVGRTTSSGLGLFQVSGDADISGIGSGVTRSRVRTVSTSAAVSLWQNSTSGTTNTDGLEIGLQGDGVTASLFNYENGPMTFATNSVERMRIDATGKVSIGKNSAQSVLDVAGQSGIIASDLNYQGTTQTIAARIASDTRLDSTAQPGLEMRRWTGSGTLHYAGRVAMDSGSAAMLFAVDTQATNTPATTERMRIDGNGNVGINTSAVVSAVKLNVAGGISSTGLNAVGTGGFFNSANKFGVDNNAGQTRFYSSGANSSTRGSYDFRITDSVGSLDTSAMVIGADGNVGLGMASSAGIKLNVDAGTLGPVASWNSSNASGIYQRFAVSGTAIGDIGSALQIFGTGTTTDFGLNSRAGFNLVFGTNQIERMRVTNAGNVGIGTTNPQQPLVVSNGGAAGLEISPTAVASAPAFVSYNRSGAAYTQLSYIALQHVFQSGSTPATALTIASTGDVTVAGAFYAATKSFLIQHPSKPGMKLRYGSLESPYHGVRLTGQASVLNGYCRVTLPDYIRDLVKDDGSQVQLTNIQHGKVLWVQEINIAEGTFDVMCETTDRELKFFWTFTAVRKDVPDMIVEE
jgi:hypothetical protein